MKKLKKFLVILVILLIALLITNKETDLLSNFPERAPEISQRFPQLSEGVVSLSEKLAVVTDPLPSFEQLIAILKNEEIPIDPKDVAHNAYISDSPFITFYPEENAAVMVEESGHEVSVFGVCGDKKKSHLVVQINDMQGNELLQTSFAVAGDGEFKKNIKIPKTDVLKLELAVYTGEKSYGTFNGWISSYVYLTRETQNSSWALYRSPVYEQNKVLYEKDKSMNEALKSTATINAANKEISSIAQKLVEGLDSDYEKLIALHDWVCSYLYYDEDIIASGGVAAFTATDVIKSRKAVCLGYANLFAALCRSAGIPCNVVSGYALGVGEDKEWTQATVETNEANHAWAEAYADGRWIIIDPTWDSLNKFRNGEWEKSTAVSHLYFDANPEFFANNHKIIEYMRR